MLGYDSAEELLQRNLEETGFVTPYSRRDFKSIIEREGKLEEFESAWIKKDGTTVFIKESAVAHYDADGKILFYEGIVEDITERKLVEKSLQKLDLAIRQSREVIFITDKEGIITFINPEFTKTYGYSAEEVLGKVSPRILKSGLVSAEVHAFLWKKILSKESVIAEYINKRKDGSLIEIEGSVDPILDEKGEIIGFLGIHRDITERKRADETIKILGNAIEQGPSSIMITNTSGKIEFVNNKFTTLTQYSLEDVSGKNPRIFNPGHLPEKEFEELWKTLRKGDTWKGEVQNRRKDGSMFWEDLTISALMNPDDTVSKYILIMNDTTERKQMMDDLFAAKEKAEESDRLKSAFLANIGHEIRTPINIIMGFAEQLNEPDLTSEEKEEYISIIGKSGRGLLNIFNDIICISKVEAGQMPVSISETNINELIEQIYSSFRDEAEQKGIMIIYDNGLTGQKNFINTDREKVNSILTNLIKNAIKFTNNGFIEIGHNQKGSYLECYVKDTGLGIKREQQEIIFEPFRQGSESLRRNYEGVGLGLSISKAYVEMLGGRIWVESLEGTGSVFYFTLPYGFEADQKNILRPVVVASAYQEDSSCNNLKILIVEDNEFSAKLLGKIVKLNSRGILIAKTGTQAVEICRENPDIDLVLMDIQLPEMNGIEATKQIREFNTDVIIIAQTAFVYTHNRQEAIDAGCNDYISKPIDQALLRKLVKEFFEKPK
jgi:PAS domain S-box-containing protein